MADRSNIVPTHRGRPNEDPIFALNREAVSRAKSGESIVNATIGAALADDGRLYILPSAMRAVREISPEHWAGYAPISGAAAFLSAAVSDMVGTQPSMKECAFATATPGGTGALRMAIANFLLPGQALLTTSYYWGPYHTLADEAGCSIDTFEMFNDSGELDVGALDRAIGQQLATQNRVLLFLNDPCHNPTGYSMTKREWQQVSDVLLKRASEGPITLLVDTAYTAYAAGNPRAFLEELRPLVGVIPLLFAWTASKTFTMYGLRVGALVACVADAEERKSMEAAFSYSCRGTWSNCNHGGQVAVANLLTNPELAGEVARERDGLKEILFRRVAVFNDCARKHGLRYPRYEGGFFVTVFADNAHDRASRMRERGVFVVPQKEALRVALCSTKESDIARLAQSIAES